MLKGSWGNILLSSPKTSDLSLYSAPWLIPITAPIQKDGCIAVKNGQIVEVGSRKNILAKYHFAKETRLTSVLMPALINAHMHLELSYLPPIAELSARHNFTDWISLLLKERAASKACREEIVAAFSSILEDQYNSGVIAVADIGNIFYPELHSNKSENWPYVYRMLEYLGPTEIAQRDALKAIDALDKTIAATAHAPYSTSQNLIASLKKRSLALNHLFSIHFGESRAEIEFILKGTGHFREFLEKKGSWDGTLTNNRHNWLETIQCLDDYNVLDTYTILVHCVHLSVHELEVIKNRGAHICICPGSNKFLGVGLAPVENMLAAGLLPALGTDSCASNSVIDIWQEMKTLFKEYPALQPGKILAMATKGGAEALHCSSEFGSMDIGCGANLLCLDSPTLRQCANGDQVITELVSGGRPELVSWLRQADGQ